MTLPLVQAQTQTQTQTQTQVQPGHYAREAEIRALLSVAIGDSRYQLWFGEGVRVGLNESGDLLELAVPNAYFRDWIQSHFAPVLITCAQSVAGRPVGLIYRLDDDPNPTAPSNPHAKPGTIQPHPPHMARVTQPPHQPVTGPTSAPTHPTNDNTNTNLSRPTARPPRRLDEFVVGPGNELAHAAALDMARHVGSTFNPMFIHGDIGLGKTHLLEGIGVEAKARHPGLRVMHLTAEAFTNRFLEAMRSSQLQSFRTRHRAADLLLVDDIHFLAAKRATLHEFLHTFNALIQDGAAIVLVADQHPRTITRLTDELVTRFLGGMVVKISPPDFATRKRILQVKAASRGLELPEPVLSFIAEHIRTSVRELEGALHSVLAHTTLTGKRLDLTMARIALRDMLRHATPVLGLKEVERAVARVFRIDPEALRSHDRARAVTYPRMLAMYVSRKHAGIPYSEIGRYFGGRNHSTVIAAEKKVESWLKSNSTTVTIPGFESPADALTALEHALGA